MLPRALSCLLSATALTLAALDARAEDPSASSAAAAAPSEGARRWYGFQTLTVGGVTSLLMGATAIVSAVKPERTANFYMCLASLSGFALGGPIVHWAHRNVGKGFASLGISVALTATGVILGAVSTGHEGKFELGTELGGMLGAWAAIAIDASVLAYDQRGPADNAASVQHRRPPALLPALDIRKDRASLGLIGTF